MCVCVCVAFFLPSSLVTSILFGMALGYIVKRKGIQGSCGGLGSIGIEKV